MELVRIQKVRCELNVCVLRKPVCQMVETHQICPTTSSKKLWPEYKESRRLRKDKVSTSNAKQTLLIRKGTVHIVIHIVTAKNYHVITWHSFKSILTVLTVRSLWHNLKLHLYKWRPIQSVLYSRLTPSTPPDRLQTGVKWLLNVNERKILTRAAHIWDMK